MPDGGLRRSVIRRLTGSERNFDRITIWHFALLISLFSRSSGRGQWIQTTRLSFVEVSSEQQRGDGGCRRRSADGVTMMTQSAARQVGNRPVHQRRLSAQWSITSRMPSTYQHCQRSGRSFEWSRFIMQCRRNTHQVQPLMPVLFRQSASQAQICHIPLCRADLAPETLAT